MVLQAHVKIDRELAINQDKNATYFKILLQKEVNNKLNTTIFIQTSWITGKFLKRKVLKLRVSAIIYSNAGNIIPLYKYWKKMTL